LLPALLLLGLGFGMIFAPGINAATTGVRREDSGVASALVNTVQQVGGSIGTSALSTIALTATASYLVAHHTTTRAPAIAATHGYTLAFAISAALLGLGCILAIVLLPSNHKFVEFRAAATTAARTGPWLARGPARPAPVPTPATAQAPDPGFEAIPVALCSCSPVVSRVPESAALPR
jgi:MFS family permease